MTRDHTPADPPAALRGVARAEVEIAAPPDAVFDALTDPAQLAEWCRATPEAPLDAWQADVRPGGRWEGAGTDAGGRPVRVAGTYDVVDPPRRLHTSWEADDGAPPSSVRFALVPTEVDGRPGTRLTVTHVGAPVVARAGGASFVVRHLRVACVRATRAPFALHR
jgi:uncharacterized protein YndB with AHSA1/START domain